MVMNAVWPRQLKPACGWLIPQGLSFCCCRAPSTLLMHCLLWSPYVIGQTIIFLPRDFYLLSFFFSSPNLRGSDIGCLPCFHTWCGLSANLECTSEMCCTWLAENTGRKKSPFRHHRTTLSGCIFAAEACINIRKKLVKHRYLLHMSS